MYAITDIYGRGYDTTTLDSPNIIETDSYKTFDSELACKRYIASIGQDIDTAEIENIDGTYYYWHDEWAQPKLQATPQGTPYPCTTIGKILDLVKMVKVDG
jgi:hypothetical protein